MPFLAPAQRNPRRKTPSLLLTMMASDNSERRHRPLFDACLNCEPRINVLQAAGVVAPQVVGAAAHQVGAGRAAPASA